MTINTTPTKQNQGNLVLIRFSHIVPGTLELRETQTFMYHFVDTIGLTVEQKNKISDMFSFHLAEWLVSWRGQFRMFHDFHDTVLISAIILNDDNNDINAESSISMVNDIWIENSRKNKMVLHYSDPVAWNFGWLLFKKFTNQKLGSEGTEIEESEIVIAIKKLIPQDDQRIK